MSTPKEEEEEEEEEVEEVVVEEEEEVEDLTAVQLSNSPGVVEVRAFTRFF